ncbi:hypothetical protein A2625_04180 [candidate division WOR-1 bacterium RIFCSPHIGHO2_01_FULL_53_15]|uniref:DUF559 domain-containing protein n=1 Tax=candidate division WOR-1 bacterium RIFCSPHIGHO2_01_FULL_53_15 TaxID=1802564 RepID=A0A1F4Q2J8_UNCSA|nr:MAG: hypothetical protein A2625_04180 [candidate division WOR-1 bacterium RIFCSPHIGHO2_01_FULL_53_15]OGC13708.1 MAG: hypothetical protein A3D23_03220 [candidate division WOR-1 bacterium RIFCSPHIGHO2_02_FULL_53_26]
MRSKKQVKILRARELRKNQTSAEERLWWILRGRKMLGFKFRRQFLFKGFIMDFYCPGLGLGLEIDGPIHSGRETYDQARQALLESHGVKLLHFTNKEVFDEPLEVLNTISQNLPFGLLPARPAGGHEVEKGDHRAMPSDIERAERVEMESRQSRDGG